MTRLTDAERDALLRYGTPVWLLIAVLMLTALTCRTLRPAEPVVPGAIGADTLKPGETVYMVWAWGARPRVIECTVDTDRGPFGSSPTPRVIVRWDTPEDFYSATAFTPVDRTTLVFRTHKEAAQVVADRLRQRARELLKEADDLQPPVLISERPPR